MTPPEPRPISVLVADPNEVSCAGLAALLANDSRFALVGETTGDVPSLARRHRPDLVVLDPERDGELQVPVIAELAAAVPDSRICIRTALFAPRTFIDAMLAGAHAYLLKGSTSAAVLHDTFALVGKFGATVIDPAITTRFRTQPGGSILLYLPDRQVNLLSSRERQVLQRVAEGDTDEQIASRLAIKRTTVESYVERLARKLRAKNRTHLVALATQQGLLDRPVGEACR